MLKKKGVKYGCWQFDFICIIPFILKWPYNKEGVGHWDRDFPYPYGNDELYVKCKMCSIDLEIYKLANKLW